jgi:gas vesicle protein
MMPADEAHEVTPQTPLIIGVTVAGLATASAVAFFVSRRSQTVRDVQRETQHAWQRTMTGGRWWRRGMLWGGALGVLIGFLLAPKRGRELRDDLARVFEQIRPQAEKLYQQGKAQVGRFMQSRQG